MKVDFSKLSTDNKLGSGVNAHAYLVHIKGTPYVYRKQLVNTDKIDAGRIKKNNNLWNEIEFFKFIDCLPKWQSVFFMKLMHYEITKGHQPIHVRRNKTSFTSPYTLHQLIEYKGDTLRSFFQKNGNVEHHIMYSILLQIYNIFKILHDALYVNGDVHMDNLTIQPTKLKTFNTIINGKKHIVATGGFLISAIDYGYIESAKNENKYWTSLNTIFDSVVFRLMCMAFNHILFSVNNTNKINYNILLHHIYKKNRSFWNTTKIYIESLYPGALGCFDKFEQQLDQHGPHSSIAIVFYKSSESESYAIISTLMVIITLIREPNIYESYKPGYDKYRIPVDIAEKLFSLKTIDDMASYLYMQLKPAGGIPKLKKKSNTKPAGGIPKLKKKSNTKPAGGIPKLKKKSNTKPVGRIPKLKKK
jgi:hypothetical protein